MFVRTSSDIAMSRLIKIILGLHYFNLNRIFVLIPYANEIALDLELLENIMSIRMIMVESPTILVLFSLSILRT